jgi:type I restriction enzyme S subunit
MEVSAMKSNVEMKIPFVQLGDIISLSKGKKHEPIGNGKNRYINIENLHNSANSLFTNEEGTFVVEDDLIIAWDGAHAGKVGVGFVGVIGSTLARMRIKSPDVSPRYLFWYLESINEWIKSQRTGATIPHVNGNSLKEIQIPLPPLSTQKRIAEILDAADALRRKDQELLKKYDELAQAIFIDMFGDPVKNEKGWEVRKLGTVSNMKAGNFISASEIYTDIDDGLYPCYGGNGLRGFVKSHTHNGDYILIGRQGALCGNVKIATGKFHATEHAVVCSPKIEYNVLWLYFLLGNLNLNKYSSGAAQPGLNVSTLVNIDLIFAPIKFQNQFAEKLKSIEIQFEKIKGNLLNSNKLFNSLIQKAFKGELVS